MLTSAPELESGRTLTSGASAQGEREATTRTTVFRTWLLLLLSRGPCRGYDLMEALRNRSLVKTTGRLTFTARSVGWKPTACSARSGSRRPARRTSAGYTS